MFTTVHRSRLLTVSIYALCGLLLLGTLRTASAQELDSAEAVLVPESTSVIQQPPYPTEGIPGGDAVVGDFVVGPGKVDVTLKPGETKVVEMIVTNRTGERRVFNLTTEDMTGSNDPEKAVVLLGNERGPYSLRDYLSVTHRSFELGHNERARIPVTISIPVDAEPGGLYGSMLVDTVAIEASSGESTQTVPQSAIIARIGTLFFVTVEGEVNKEAKLLEFATIGKKRFFTSGPISFGILHENTGSIHIAPYGEVRVTNMLGEEIGFVELEPWFILPRSERLREIRFDRDFLFGRYTATINVNRSYDDIIDIKSWSFWVLPWKILIGGFGIIFLVLFLIRAFFRTFEFKRKG
jgi:hypothetical protein